MRLIRASLVAALFALLGWLVLEASDMSDAANAADAFAAIPTVLLGTSFGHDLFAQGLAVLAALVLLTVWPRRRQFAAVGLVGLTLALQAGHSHAFAMEHGPSLLRGLHLLAGGAWLGGLLPLLTLVRDVPPNPAAETLRRFSALRHRGGVAGLIGTAYGWVLLLKAALFAALLGLAAINRFRLTPALERQDA